MSFRSILSGIVGLGSGCGLTYYLLKRDNSAGSISNPPIGSNISLVPNSGSSDSSLVQLKPKELFKYGFPGPIHDIEDRYQYISCYNRQTRNPYWVLEHITPESLALRNGDRKNSFFKEDERIPEMFRAKLKDYFGSGYDRGHQVPAADAKFSQNSMDQTFYLTNISPQVGVGFNRDYWSHFEYFCRQLTQKYNNVRIITGPLFLPKKDEKDGKFRVTYEVIGNPPNVSVPTHFFKLIVAENPKQNPTSDKVSVAAFVLPNEPIPNETKITDFEVPVNALERSTGLELLKNLPENKTVPLCKEVKCQLVIREFNNSVKSLPPK
ncbi:ribonuclease PWA37_003581 [Arxiozyma heterogenica]|uniref:Endonuclease n=1 Tax=Arxiozyma heterogenica TaxID=278026 RepID=A0AAN7WS16_9SACH|nr:hypothetical protein RI543_002049 [Kazachstania heterogenica]